MSAYHPSVRAPAASIAILAVHEPPRCPEGQPEPTERLLESLDLAQRLADLLSDRQAQDIVLMDISPVSTFTDVFVIATAGNPRQMGAILDALDRDLRDEGIRPSRTEGTPESGWVLVDFGDAIVHLFSPEERAYYDLEGLWSKGVSVIHIQ